MSAPETHTFTKAAPEIVRKIRSGDHGAYELFYRMEFLNLVHFSDSYLNDTERAYDIAQETLLALWENRHLLDPEKNIRSFVFTIARNKTLNELRNRKLFDRGTSVEDALDRLLDNSVEEYIGALELSSLIRKVWESLPSSIGDTFSKSREEGLKNRVIALREGISVKTVEYRIKIALRRFRKILEKYL